MKSKIEFSKFLLISWFLVLSCSLIAQNNKPYQFISPRPSSVMVSYETNIILRHSSTIDQKTLSEDLISIEGSISGVHAGELVLSDDDQTIVFNPYEPFTGNEEVNVVIQEGVKTKRGSDIPKYSFKFNTVQAGIIQIPEAAFSETISKENDQNQVLKANGTNAFLPPPPITVDSVNNPSDGYIFMATYSVNFDAHQLSSGIYF